MTVFRSLVPREVRGRGAVARCEGAPVSERVFERASHQARSFAHWCTGGPMTWRCRTMRGCTSERASLRASEPFRHGLSLIGAPEVRGRGAVARCEGAPVSERVFERASHSGTVFRSLVPREVRGRGAVARCEGAPVSERSERAIQDGLSLIGAPRGPRTWRCRTMRGCTSERAKRANHSRRSFAHWCPERSEDVALSHDARVHQ